MNTQIGAISTTTNTNSTESSTSALDPQQSPSKEIQIMNGIANDRFSSYEATLVNEGFDYPTYHKHDINGDYLAVSSVSKEELEHPGPSLSNKIISKTTTTLWSISPLKKKWELVHNIQNEGSRNHFAHVSVGTCGTVAEIFDQISITRPFNYHSIFPTIVASHYVKIYKNREETGEIYIRPWNNLQHTRVINNFSLKIINSKIFAIIAPSNHPELCIWDIRGNEIGRIELRYDESLENYNILSNEHYFVVYDANKRDVFLIIDQNTLEKRRVSVNYDCYASFIVMNETKLIIGLCDQDNPDNNSNISIYDLNTTSLVNRYSISEGKPQFSLKLNEKGILFTIEKEKKSRLHFLCYLSFNDQTIQELTELEDIIKDPFKNQSKKPKYSLDGDFLTHCFLDDPKTCVRNVYSLKTQRKIYSVKLTMDNPTPHDQESNYDQTVKEISYESGVLGIVKKVQGATNLYVEDFKSDGSKVSTIQRDYTAYQAT